MPYPNEHALRLKSPGLFDPKSFRRTAGGTLFGGNVKVPATIGIIWAKLKGKSAPSDPPILQALRFKKSAWTVANAKAWIKKHLKQRGRFEPAASSSATEQSEGIDSIEDMIVGDDEQYGSGTEMSEDDLELIFEEDGETAEVEASEQNRQLMGDDGETADEDSSTESGDDDLDTFDDDQEDDDDEDDQETYTIENVELFSAGTWKGDKYSTADLDQMVTNFNKLKRSVKPPFLLGHGDQSLLRASGLPAAGWVVKLRRVGKKLMADIGNAPKAVYNLIKKKAYKRISCEIYQNYQDSKGIRHGLTLSRVAILGGDIPAVKTLKDIEALYYENSHDNTIRTVTYTMPETTEEKLTKDKDKKETEESSEEKKEETTTEEEEEKEEETSEEETEEDKDKDKEKEETEQSTVDVAEQDARIKALEKIVEAQDAKISSMAEESERQAEESAVVKDEAFLDKLTEQGTFPPALREKSLLLMSAYRNETGVLKYTEKVDDKDVEIESTAYDVFTGILETLPTMIEMSELGTGETTRPGSEGETTGKGDRRYDHIDGHDVKDVALADAADKYYEEHKTEGITYSDALIAAQREV